MGLIRVVDIIIKIAEINRTKTRPSRNNLEISVETLEDKGDKQSSNALQHVSRSFRDNSLGMHPENSDTNETYIDITSSHRRIRPSE